MELNNYLKMHRAKLGLNQAELGKLVGASRQTISSIERKEYNPSIVLALKLSVVLGVSVDELFELEGFNNE